MTGDRKRRDLRSLLSPILWFSGSLTFAYLSLATQLFISSLSLRYWFLLSLTFAIALAYLVNVARKNNIYGKWIPQLTLVLTASIITMLAADTIYNFLLNKLGQPLRFAFHKTSQTGALEINLGIPRFDSGYDGRFKPFVTVGGQVFGELVPPLLVDDENFSKLVVQSRYVMYETDEFGYRNKPNSWTSSDIVAMGDSFVFGTSIYREETWVYRLEKYLQEKNSGCTVYNLGEPGTAPLGQAKRFQELQQIQPTTPRLIIWMLFGGNDLMPDQTEEFTTDSTDAFAGTLLIGPLRMLESIRNHSIIGRIRGNTMMPLTYPDSYYFSGHLLPAPLYSSPDLGAKLFYPPYIAEAQKTKEQTLASPGIARIEQAFNMLQQTIDLPATDVLIAFAPSAEHLIGPKYDHFPSVGAPALAEWLNHSATSHGFEFLDLTESLGIASDTANPYFTDDTHWNSFGHEVVEQAIYNRMSASDEGW